MKSVQQCIYTITQISNFLKYVTEASYQYSRLFSHFKVSSYPLPLLSLSLSLFPPISPPLISFPPLSPSSSLPRFPSLLLSRPLLVKSDTPECKYSRRHGALSPLLPLPLPSLTNINRFKPTVQNQIHQRLQI